MQQVYNKKDECCGCTACLTICPFNAISFEADEDGFKFPIINRRLCTDCGLCKKVCKFVAKDDKYDFEKPICYAAINKDSNIVKKSRSGGVFTGLSDEILSKGGIIYGVSLDKDFIVRHKRAGSVKVRDTFRKSKYVQSELGKIFNDIAADLKNDYDVLFSGTPCQCDGLRSFIQLKKVKSEKLILVDVICHGVPSPLVFRKYLDWINKKSKEPVFKFEFRDKNKFPWWTCIEKIQFKKRSLYQDYYGKLFHDSLITRSSCFNCKYATIHHNSDITLGDYWGVQKTFPDLYNKDGVSLVMIHSNKGQALYNRIEHNFTSRKTDVENVLQPRLESSAEMPSLYENFWKDFRTCDFDFIIKKYGYNSQSLLNKSRNYLFRLVYWPYRATRKVLKLIIQLLAKNNSK